MDNGLYWVSAFVYALVITSILINDIHENKKPNKAEKAFRSLMQWVIIFCLQDAVWGLCDNRIINNDKIFFLSTTLFHCATVITTFFWLRYIVLYLGDKIKNQSLLLFIDILVVILQFGMLIINFFKPIIFRIVDGEYVMYSLRPLTFFNQYIVYFTIGLSALVCALREAKTKRKRYFSVFIFSLAPILSGAFQYLYPQLPFYSMGYFMACFIIHIFVISKEREDARQNVIISSIANIYYTMHLIDFTDNTAETYIDKDIVKGASKKKKNALEILNLVMREIAVDEYLEGVLEFIDTTNLSSRLKDKNIISHEFVQKGHGWTRLSFIPVEWRGDELTKAMLVTQIIDDEKRRELQLIYQSNNDQLTGLFNRHAFEEDSQISLKTAKAKKLVIVSADINGLKMTNDTIGHAAGDEIIVGAADCLKYSFGNLGRIYRIGGDEFVVMMYANERELENAIDTFNRKVLEWKGELVDTLSVSLGYATYKDNQGLPINELLNIADKKMYDQKALYYAQKEART